MPVSWLLLLINCSKLNRYLNGILACAAALLAYSHENNRWGFNKPNSLKRFVKNYRPLAFIKYLN
jgi:hypothetical protein